MRRVAEAWVARRELQSHTHRLRCTKAPTMVYILVRDLVPHPVHTPDHVDDH